MTRLVTTMPSRPNPHPSMKSTMEFLKLCDAIGSQKAALDLIDAGRQTGATGLPTHNDWPAWTAPGMNAAVAYLKLNA